MLTLSELNTEGFSLNNLNSMSDTMAYGYNTMSMLYESNDHPLQDIITYFMLTL